MDSIKSPTALPAGPRRSWWSDAEGRLSPHLLFFASGFTALVFEVVWAKQACLIFGNTSLASATVIGSFMAGLAIGSRLFGWWADRNPHKGWVAYGWLEGGVAVYALLFPWILGAMEPLYAAAYARWSGDFMRLSLARAALAFALLAVPTTLMGGTLPLLSRFLSRTASDGGRQAGGLYTLNLFGAAAGAFASGYILLELLGVRGASLLASAINLAICAAVLTDIRARATAPLPAADAEIAAPDGGEERLVAPGAIRLVYALLALHGFAAFVVQICWVRACALILSSSTYALSATLTVYLLGLAIGGLIVTRCVCSGVRPTAGRLGYLEASAGVAVLLFIPMFENAAFGFARVFPYVYTSPVLVMVTQLALAIAIMVVPTVLIGAFLPATLCLLGRSAKIGRVVGRCYAFNTAGALAGSFLTAFVLIPGIGVHGSILVASFVFVISGVWLVAVDPEVRGGLKVRRIIAAVLPAFLLMFYPWSRELFGSGVAVYADSWSRYAMMGRQVFFEVMKQNRDLVFYRDGISSTVTVLRYQDQTGRVQKSLRVNGKTDASTVGDMATQLYLGYIPLFAHPNPKNVLVIGLGAGVTVGTATQFDSVRSIECVEIEPAVVDANRFFSIENHFALRDPRVKVVIGDGRNHVRFTPKKYDVIISEPSNPWIAGISSLFSREHYRASLAALSEEGVFGQWFHSYQMTPEDFQMIIRTFAEVFPHTELYRLNGSDYMLLGSRGPVRYESSRIRKTVRSKPLMSSDLKFFTDSRGDFVTRTFLLSNEDLRAFLKDSPGPVITDDRLLLEYRAPRNLYRSSGDVADWIDRMPRKTIFPDYKDVSPESLIEAPEASHVILQQAEAAIGIGDPERALRYFAQAVRIKGYDAALHRQIGMTYESIGRFVRARQHYMRALKDPSVGPQAASLMRRARIRAMFLYNPLMSRDVELRNLIARLSYFGGDIVSAMRLCSEAMDMDPTYLKNYADMAVYSASVGLPKEAYELLRKASEVNPNDPAVLTAAELIRRQYGAPQDQEA
ncbi:MAG: Polyamine aminopropyltransferase [Candidatus Omnitrophica bacterium]|nr:Polyamine aminopropyltransferase [Candidatus Omnitrophota bacterium]